MSDSSARHNAVTALAEADATGETAEIFADIRATMQIPLLTSIWRILADFDGGLRAAWDATKPLYESGQPGAALAKLKQTVPLPVPESLTGSEMASLGVSLDDLPKVRAIADAYNRSNGLNLIALTALVVRPSDEPSPAMYPAPPTREPWPELPVLLARDEIDDKTWASLESVDRYGTDGAHSGIATFWRHLGHWPGLIAETDARLAPLDRDGAIERTAQGVFDFARAEGARIAHLRADDIAIPEPARELIAGYVSSPTTVTHIVNIGHGIAQWLEETAHRAQ
jgi:hypothetical protein